MLQTLTQDALAELLRRHDQDHRQSTLVISALLELLGGQAHLPFHALQNAPGYQCTPGAHSGDLILSAFSSPH